MKKRVFLCLLFISIPVRTFAAVHITEIAWMGVSGDNGQYGEWIELHNDAAEPVDITGWKLYAENGEQLLYTFSSNIPANGYVVAERTTGSMTDPVPIVDDEHGTFGGGGFSNNGEDLVLKDTDDAVVESLSYGSGWPAGDATTKQTMQWNGSSWITADPTPKAQTVSSNGDTADTAENIHTADTPASSKKVVISKEKSKPIKPKPHIELTIPRQLQEHVPYTFTPVVYTQEDMNPVRGMYRWNFGDGTFLESNGTSISKTHTYLYPGTYTVWFGYYNTVFDEDPVLSVSTILSVNHPDISAAVVDIGSVQITNNSSETIDLSKWRIVSGPFQSVIPPMTVLSPRAQITIPSSVLHVPFVDGLQLYAPDGSMIEQ